MIRSIIREVEPEACDFSSYFDGDCFTEAGGDFCYNLFIICDDGWGRISGFNADRYKDIVRDADRLIDAFNDVEYPGNCYNWTGYRSYKEAMEDFAIPYNSRKCHLLKERAKDADTSKTEDIAEYLTIITGKKWDVDSVRGYSQGDYCEIVYCPDHYLDGVKAIGEVFLGCAKEFCVIDVEDFEIDENGEAHYTETDSCYGFIVADSEARYDEDYKRLVCEWEGLKEDETRLEMIDGYHTYAKYDYRVA